VKTLNHVGYHDLDVDARPHSAPDRHGMAVVGNNPDAVVHVAVFIDRLGYDPATANSLDAGIFLQPGGSIFAKSLSGAQIQTHLDSTCTRTEAVY